MTPNWPHIRPHILEVADLQAQLADLRAYLHEAILAYEKLERDEAKLNELYEKSLDRRQALSEQLVTERLLRKIAEDRPRDFGRQSWHGIPESPFRDNPFT